MKYNHVFDQKFNASNHPVEESKTGGTKKRKVGNIRMGIH